MTRNYRPGEEPVDGEAPLEDSFLSELLGAGEETEPEVRSRESQRRGRARRTLSDVVNAEVDRKAVKALIAQALELNSFTRAFCPNCRKSVNVEVPDLKKRVDVLVALLEQAEGKPGSEEAGVSIVVERPALRENVA